MPIENESKPSMEAVILEEIENFHKTTVPNESKEEALRSYLNNFVHKIPGSDGVSNADFLFIPKPAELDAKLKERRNSRPFRFDENNAEEMAEIHREGYSDKFIFQPYQQFIDDINTAIENSGVDRTALVKFIEEVRARKTPFDPIDGEKEKELVFPVFVKLRDMGYSLKDLRG